LLLGREAGKELKKMFTVHFLHGIVHRIKLSLTPKGIFITDNRGGCYEKVHEACSSGERQRSPLLNESK
jgi:hypothetical protein